ncbi:MAG: alkaline shock response membrane anchor protein AmaP [Candidatus Omnitrophica bacterium]|nr:alkaline shock response membrane anchor protein AmaP [Candidatus Omnitrophota bacterium]
MIRISSEAPIIRVIWRNFCVRKRNLFNRPPEKEVKMRILTAGMFIIVGIWAGFLCAGLAAGLIDAEILALYLNTYVLVDTYTRTSLGLVGILLILLCIRYIRVMLFQSKRDKSLLLEAPEGKVRITLFALEDLIRRMLDEREEIVHVKPRIHVQKRSIEVVVRSNLAQEVNLMEFTSDIQRQVKDRLQNLLGEEKEINVLVNIRKVSLPGKKMEEKEEPEVPFRNY